MLISAAEAWRITPLDWFEYGGHSQMIKTLPVVTLGGSGLRVSRIGLGTAPLGDLYTSVSDTQATRTVHAALDCGITLFDTAPLYGAGKSERRLGAALRGVPRESYQLSSKVGRVIEPDGSVRFDWTRDGILRSIEASLKRLQTSYLDIVHLHDPDDAEQVAVTVAYPVLVNLKREGVVRAISAGMNQWQMLERLVDVVDLDCVLLAGRYTLLEQGALDSMLPHCQARCTAVLAAGIYNSGILATGPRVGAKYNYIDAPPEVIRRVEQLAAICERHDVSLHAAATQFPLGHPAVTAILVGAATPIEIMNAVEAYATPIPTQLWHDLREAGLIDSDAPLPDRQTMKHP